MNLGKAVEGLLIFGIFLLIFLGGGSYYIIRSIRANKKARQSQTWPSVPGLVIKSCVFERWSGDSDGGMTIWYEPQIIYKYQVMGTIYTSERLFIGPKVSFLKLRRSQDIINRLTDGKTVTVFYNPDDPADAVLDRRSSGSTSLFTGITLAFIGLIFLSIVVSALLELFFNF